MTEILIKALETIASGRASSSMSDIAEVALLDYHTEAASKGLKNDQDLYEKVDYSLVPLDLIVDHLNHSIHGNLSIDETDDFTFFSKIHDILNGIAPAGVIRIVLEDVLAFYGIKPLTVSLGIGIAKYNERDNWKKFDSDPDRFLRAALRHLMAIMTGADYDHEEGISGYDKGNDHRGAVCFNLMVADNILNKAV